MIARIGTRVLVSVCVVVVLAIITAVTGVHL
jgi:hypothetical protein